MAKMETLTDAFTGSNLNASLWTTVNGLGDQVTDGSVSIPETSASPTLQSAYTYDLTGSYLRVGVQAVNMQSGQSIKLALCMDANNQIQIIATTGQITFQTVVASVPQNPTVFQYDSVSMAYWRIRELSGAVLFDTSPNGVTWLLQRTDQTWFALNALTVQFVGGA
jgi:hypothetical protein